MTQVKMVHAKKKCLFLGFPNVARKKVEIMMENISEMPSKQRKEVTKLKDWTTDARAQESEFRVCQMLQRIFSKEPGLLLSGFKENSFKTLAKILDPDKDKDIPPKVMKIILF